MVDMVLFNDDVFFMMLFIVSINELEIIFLWLVVFGLFEEEGMIVIIVQIECDGEQLQFVVLVECGLFGQVVVGSKCQVILFNVVYLLEIVIIKVDEVQNLCVFGEEIELEVLQSVVSKCLQKMCCQFDVMYEFYCIGVIKGQIFDLDGKFVLVDLFECFGLK